MSVWAFADRLAPVPPDHRVTLGEGRTPLVRSRRIGPAAGIDLSFKLESANPTGSYKDRFAAVAVADMLAHGLTRCVATSSGNTGSALAAYCAAAGIACEIAIVETAPAGKLTQMLAYGAELYRVKGFGLDPAVTAATFEHVQARGRRPGAALQVSAYRYSPVGMTGVQTIAYELAEQLPGGIDHVFCCAGGGGLTLAVARGFAALGRGPAVECVQPEGNATIAGPLRRGEARAVEVVCTSRISGLQVPNVIDGDDTIAACRATGGTGHLVPDDEVYAVQARLAAEEGVFAEPAAAVPLAGALRAAAEGRVRPGAVVVCLVTGTGFKDAAAAERMTAARPCPTLSLDECRGRGA